MQEDLRPVDLKGHKTVIEGKRRVTVTAVEDIDSFNENEVIFLTAAGMMTVTGSDLHINRLSLEEGLIIIDGEVDSVDYADLAEERTERPGMFSKLFK